MKKLPELPSIFIVYLLTVPTNVMCLGAFTEVWLNHYALSRSSLAMLYLVATAAVFFAMAFLQRVHSTKIAFLTLSIIALILVLIPNNMVILFLFFFLTQWLGQGCLVGQCRCRLFAATSTSYYGRIVGFLEAMGTCAVFLCPFFMLFLIQHTSWQTTLCLIALIYACSAFFFQIPQQIRVGSFGIVFKDIKFWLANLIIYLPVIFFSGLFFHLEGLCKAYSTPLKTWEFVSQMQVPGIIIGQVFFGYLWRNHAKMAMLFLLILILSQILWLTNLFCFNLTLCITCGVIGWSLFGVLVNAFWSCLYHKQSQHIDESIRASVAFGFLANAIGPILFCAFLH